MPTPVPNRTITLLNQAPPPLHNLVVYPHPQQHPLQAPRNHIHAPSTPALAPQPRRQTGRPHEAARRLDAHHGQAQAANSLEAERRVELGEVLDACQDGGEDAEGVGPGLEVVGITGGDDHAREEYHDEVYDGGDCDEEGGRVGGLLGRGVFGKD